MAVASRFTKPGLPRFLAEPSRCRHSRDGGLRAQRFFVAASFSRFDAVYPPAVDSLRKHQVRFNPRFYIIGLVFLIFDIETVFIFPWAVILKGAGPFVLVEMVIFLAILVVGLAYVWGKRDLEWIKLPTRWQ